MILGVAVLVSSVVARRSRLAPPVLLLACGALLGFVPALRRVQLPPQVVLLLFLPALLYWESLTISLRDIRSNLRVIVLRSAALVIATAAALTEAAGQVQIDVPRDRAGTFEPQIVKKRQRRLTGVDEIVLPLMPRA